jgi:hypothetical protein
VDAAGERDVFVDAGAVERELVGGIEARGIAVDRPDQEHHRGTGRDLHAGEQRGGPTGETEVALHRALEPEDLLHERGDRVPSGTQVLLLLRVLAEVLERECEAAGGRLLPRGEEERRLVGEHADRR